MIIFSDKYMDEIGKLHKALDCLGVDAEIMVLEDNTGGRFFTLRVLHCQTKPGETRGAEIVLRCPVGAGKKGIVQCVEWYMEEGWIYRVDFYNKYGLRYASESRGADGTAELDQKLYKIQHGKRFFNILILKKSANADRLRVLTQGIY